MNNQTTPTTSTLLKNKLGTLVNRLQQQALPGGGRFSDFKTLESVVAESVKILSSFYKTLSEPGFTPTKIIPDTLPDAATFNQNFLAIQDDLVTVFDEFENLEGVVMGEFNYMVSRLNRLHGKLKEVSSSLGDFILFSDLATKDAIFFADSFNNLNRIESNSPLLNAEQGEINQVEGIVSLPIDRQAQVPIKISAIPIINSNSNGKVGNNEEAGAVFHGVITDILDSNADTWFEYERVVSADDGVALTLDLTINLGESKVINFIRLNPNNFGTRTQVDILTIDTSVNGQDFVSIKDDIPIANFTVEDEANVFQLAPATSKFAGQGLYTFTPRFAKYVRLTLRQTTAYTIKTAAGTTKSRYAIGLRDIEIQALPYKTDGEIVSTEFLVNDDIRKVVLFSNQNPASNTTSSLASIMHYISPDNGVTWHNIRPKNSSGQANVTQTTQELIDFNGVSANTIKTNSPVKSLRYKAVLKRNTDAFKNNAAELVQDKAETTELHTPPSTTPFTILLREQPVPGTLNLIDPQFGSRGKEDVRYNVAVGTGNKLTIYLPFKPFVRDVQKGTSGGYPTLIDKDPEVIYVDGTAWTRGKLSTSTDQKYTLNYEEGKLTFGDGTNGKAVPQGSIISMHLKEERIFPSNGPDHLATLNYPTSNDKKQMEVYRVDPPTAKTELLKKNATRHQLQPDILPHAAPYEIKIIDTTVFDPALYIAFVDGSSEFGATTGRWSVDYANGVLYSYTPTVSTQDTTITYFYNPRTKLQDHEWQFVKSNKGVASQISIADSAFKTIKYAIPGLNYPLLSGDTYFNLPHMGIVKGTLKLRGVFTVTDPTVTQEVDFIDGYTELSSVIQTSESLAAITGVAGATDISIPFSLRISSDSRFAATFDNQEIFKSEKATQGAVAQVGDYWIDRTTDTSTTGRVLVRVDENITDPGSVSYYYNNPQTATEGRYSVNYQTGEVYTVDSRVSGRWADYEYTDYRVRYDIARLVPADDWEFDTASKKITIKDREILKNHRTPQSVGQAGTSANKFYQASYQYVKSTRDNINQLEAYFSPILKDYALKVITKSRLV